MFVRAIALAVSIFILAPAAIAQEAEGPMTVERLIQVLIALDPETRPSGNGFELTIEDIPVLVIVDPASDRMRAMVSISDAADMTEEEVRRVLQANFDTALDARYAIAQGRLWGTFIHPLSPLQRDQLISGLGQTVNLALTYGSFYTGGAMSFRGGDSGEIHRDLIERLLERGEEL